MGKRRRNDAPRPEPEPEIPEGKEITTDNIAESVLHSKRHKADIAEIADAILTKMGGIVGMVEKIVEDYKQAYPGSAERARLHELMMRAISMANQKEASLTNLDEMTAEELDAELQRQLDRIGVKAEPKLKEPFPGLDERIDNGDCGE